MPTTFYSKGVKGYVGLSKSTYHVQLTIIFFILFSFVFSVFNFNNYLCRKLSYIYIRP